MPETRKSNVPKSKQTVTPGPATPKPNRQSTGEAKPNTPKFNLDVDTDTDYDSKINRIIAAQETMTKTIEKLHTKCNLQSKRLDEKDIEIARLAHKIEELDRNADMVQTKLADLENETKLHNIRIDGKPEQANENLKSFLMELAQQMGTAVEEKDIESVYRIGKSPSGNRPRTIMVKFTTKEPRNRLYFSRTKLNTINGDGNRSKIWINDDITASTARQREELRSIADLCREKGEAEVKVHTDGIIIRNKKFRIDSLSALPSDLTLKQAKTVTRQGQVYFQSQHSVLSNLYPCQLTIAGKHYSSAEQALQCMKADCVNDQQTSRRIWSERDVYEQKRLGGLITENKRWNDEKLAILETIITAKFEQNPLLKEELLNTGDSKLNEATRDSYWGIGSTLNSPAAKNHSWRGANHTGKALEAVRTKLR